MKDDLAAIQAQAGYGSAAVPAARPDAGRIDRAVARLIDHTLLKPEAAEADIRQVCAEAREYGFASVCVNGTWVPLVSAELQGTGVAACAVVGFPLGATLTAVKRAEAEACVAAGAQELDMVLSIGALRSGHNDAVREDISAVVGAGAPVKVILETCLLTDEEKERACRLAQEAGAAFVKTSTGFNTGGATEADVALMRRVVGPAMGVKASGGIRTLADVRKMVAAGATRIGASAGVRIVAETAA